MRRSGSGYDSGRRAAPSAAAWAACAVAWQASASSLSPGVAGPFSARAWSSPGASAAPSSGAAISSACTAAHASKWASASASTSASTSDRIRGDAAADAAALVVLRTPRPFLCARAVCTAMP